MRDSWKTGCALRSRNLQKRKIESNVITPTLEYFSENIDDLVWSQDEPFNTTSPFAQWCVFKLAKNKGIVVMLDGQGADEILAGYHSADSGGLWPLAA